MKLVQKLPIALCLVGALMFSSCSKEDVQMPEPKVESANSHSNQKVKAGGAFISTTQTEYMGEGILPNSWSRNNAGFSNDVGKYPVGVSHLYRLWGDLSRPFVNGMSIIPWASYINSFITVTTQSTSFKTSKSSVKTTIKSLIPGKKYSFTVYVGSSLPKASPGTPYATFAKSCLISVGSQETVIDMSNSYYSWIQKVITFTATSPQMELAFSASPKQTGYYAYAHLMVVDGALKQVN